MVLHDCKRSPWAEERIWSYKPKKRDRTNTFAVHIPVTHLRLQSLYFYTPHTLRTNIHPYTTHQPLQTYTNLHTTNIPTLQTPLHPTYLPYPYLPFLHTYTIPTNLQNTTYLPNPYIPTLPLQLLHPTLYVFPISAHLLYEHSTRWCGCVLPVMGYYVLRYLLAKLLYLNLIDFMRASWRRKRCWIPTKICNSSRLHNHYIYIYKYMYKYIYTYIYTYIYINKHI